MTIVSRCANDNDCGLWRSKVQLRASRSSSNALRQFVAAAIPPRSDPCSSSSSVAESSSREAGEVRTWVHQWWWWWWWGPSGQLAEWSTCRQYCYQAPACRTGEGTVTRLVRLSQDFATLPSDWQILPKSRLGAVDGNGSRVARRLFINWTRKRRSTGG